jgi:hypothetical protein
MGAFAVPTMPVAIIEKEQGVFELTYDLSRPVFWGDHGDLWSAPWTERERTLYENRRIIVDTRSPIQTIRYYINEAGRDLIRFRGNPCRGQYTAERTEYGIRLAWRFPNLDVWIESASVSLYRSVVRGERGARLWTHGVSTFEYTDTTASPYGTYFYSLWLHDGHEQSVVFNGEWQIGVE